MRISPRNEAASNCIIDCPGFGRISFMIDTLGHGMQIATQADGVTRRQRTFYPFVRTSGLWYIGAIFPERSEREALHSWLLWYIAKATNPHETTPVKPLTVMVPKENFTKTGYPTSALEFGEEFGGVMFTSRITFTSASDPSLSPSVGSRYLPPSDAAAKNFYPGGNQDNSLPDPLPRYVSPTSGDDIWDSGPWWSGGFFGGGGSDPTTATVVEVYDPETGQMVRRSTTQPLDNLNSSYGF